MTNAVMAVMEGTGDVQEIFSNMFKNIGKAFISMAMEMITKLLVIRALQMIAGMIGGGTSSVGGVMSGGAVPGSSYGNMGIAVLASSVVG